MFSLPSPQALVSTFLSLTLLSACAIEGSGHIETIEPKLDGDVRELSVHSGLRATVTQGDKPSLRITGDDNLLEELVTRESKGTLEIGLPDSLGGYRPSEPILVEASLPLATRFSSSGGGRLTLEGMFEGDDLALHGSGGGQLTVEGFTGTSLFLGQSGGGTARLAELELETLLIESAGGGEVRLSGQAGDLAVQLSGGGRLEALDLMAKAVSLDLSGGSDARVHATSSLDANVSGGGTVTYRGEPKTIKKELSGGSQLESE